VSHKPNKHFQRTAQKTHSSSPAPIIVFPSVARFCPPPTSPHCQISQILALVANPNEPTGTMEDLRTEEAMRDMRSAPTEVLLHTAAEVVAGKVAGSHIFDSTAEARVPKFDKHELTLGRVLGRGGFCIVQEIEKIKTCESSSGGGSMLSRRSLFKMPRRPFKAEKKPMPSSAAVPRIVESDIESVAEYIQDIGFDVKKSRDFVASRSKSKRTRGRYVIKQVALELRHDDTLTFLKGTVDLAMETKYLSALNHPNIIKLCGQYTGGPYTMGYFVVLEKLSETLTKRIKKWMDVDRRSQGFPGVCMGSKITLEDLMTERLLASNDIALGGAYLHSRKVMFRDLVSDTIHPAQAYMAPRSKQELISLFLSSKETRQYRLRHQRYSQAI
jgi:serine/threonine protein kinase